MNNSVSHTYACSGKTQKEWKYCLPEAAYKGAGEQLNCFWYNPCKYSYLRIPWVSGDGEDKSTTSCIALAALERERSPACSLSRFLRPMSPVLSTLVACSNGRLQALFNVKLVKPTAGCRISSSEPAATAWGWWMRGPWGTEDSPTATCISTCFLFFFSLKLWSFLSSTGKPETTPEEAAASFPICCCSASKTPLCPDILLLLSDGSNSRVWGISHFSISVPLSSGNRYSAELLPATLDSLPSLLT